MNPVQVFYDNPYFENLKVTKPFLEYLKREEQKLREIIQGGRVLDIGCGNGRSTLILSDISDFAVGLDFSERLLEQARINLDSRKNVKLYLEDAKSMHFDDNFFDYVVMLWNTFGNLYSTRDRVLQEAKRVLSSDGTIIISAFSENVLAPYLEMLKQNNLTIIHQDENYLFLKEGLVSERFSRKKLECILSKSGLKPGIEELNEISYWCRATR